MSDDLIASLEAAYAEGKTLAWGLCKPAAARIRELGADLARAKSELEEWQGIADAHLRTIHATEPAYIALAAKLARCEAMLVEGKGQIAACGNQGLVRRIDAYFAEQEPRT